jgi:hypothetical protein
MRKTLGNLSQMKFKKIQPSRKSIMADPRVKELWFEGGGRRPGQSAYDADDRWWLTYEDGYVCTENHTRTTNSYTLRDIASMINSSCMSIEEYKREFPGFALPG